MSENTSSDSPLSEVEQQLAEIVAREAMVDISKVTPDTRLEELNIQSADFVMILMDIEEKFGLYLSVDNDMAQVKTVRDFTQLITRALEKQRSEKQSEDQIS